MKKLFMILTALAVLIQTVSSFSQGIGEIELLNQLDKKMTASYGDAVSLFMLQKGKSPSVFEQDSAALLSEGIGLKGYNQDAILTKGMLSKMTTEYLKLRGSFMYLIFSSERYAFKVCVANEIFTPDGSSSDKLTGPEILEVFSRISELKGEQK